MAIDLSNLDPCPWKPGLIFEAYLTYSLADGTWVEGWMEIMVLDARHDAGAGTVRLLWEHAVKGKPGGSLRRSVVWDAHGGPGHDRNPGESVDRSDVVRLLIRSGVPVGEYAPNDPRANSIEVLRDHAIARMVSVEQDRVAGLARDVGSAATEARVAAAAAKEAAAHRDVLIRQALSGGSNPWQLATATGLSVQRIYQIRDGGR